MTSCAMTAGVRPGRYGKGSAGASVMRARFINPLTVSIISLIVAVLGFGVTAYESAYNTNVDAGKSIKYSLTKGKSSVASVSPAAGLLSVGYIQTSGKVKGKHRTKYRGYYRTTNAASWTSVKSWRNGMRTLSTKTFMPSRNKRYSSAYPIAYTNGKKKYLFKWSMIAGKGKSRGHVDLLLD